MRNTSLSLLSAEGKELKIFFVFEVWSIHVFYVDFQLHQPIMGF